MPIKKEDRIRSRAVVVNTIMNFVANRFHVTQAQLTNGQRSQHLVAARNAASYALRRFTNLSFPRIGDIMGGRDHSSIIHACNMARKAPWLPEFIQALQYELDLVATRGCCNTLHGLDLYGTDAYAGPGWAMPESPMGG